MYVHIPRKNKNLFFDLIDQSVSVFVQPRSKLFFYLFYVHMYVRINVNIVIQILGLTLYLFRFLNIINL